MRLQESVQFVKAKLPEIFSSERADVTTTESLKFITTLGEVALATAPAAALHPSIQSFMAALSSACQAMPIRVQQVCTYTLLDTFNSSLWTLHRKASQTRSEEHLNAVVSYRFLYEQRIAGMTRLLSALPDVERTSVRIGEVTEKLDLLKEDFISFDEELIWNHAIYGESVETLRWQFTDMNFWLANPDMWKQRVGEVEPRLKWTKAMEKQRFKKFLLSRKSPKTKTPFYVLPSAIKPMSEADMLSEIEQYEQALFNHQTPKPMPEFGGASIYAHYALLCLEQNQPLKALALFRKNLMLNLKNPDSWLNLGVGNFLAGTLHRAKFCFEKAYTLRDDIFTANDLAAVYATLGFREKAKSLWKKYIKNEAAIEPTYNTGTLLLAENNLLEAGKLFQWCGEHDKAHGETAFNMAIVMEREAKDFLAERYFTLAAKLGVK
ncbi:MAG: tetratricopeptide repeat protein [Chlorobiales bacterium]